MKDILANFDDNSRKVIKELIKDNEKFTGLIEKLQIARDIVDNKVGLISALTQEIKK